LTQGSPSVSWGVSWDKGVSDPLIGCPSVSQYCIVPNNSLLTATGIMINKSMYRNFQCDWYPFGRGDSHEDAYLEVSQGRSE
jgi:hypothetical protein